MSVNPASTEAAFGQLWQAYLGQYGQPEGAYKLVDSFFEFIRNTGMFNDPDAVSRVQQIATKHVTLSAKELQSKQAADAKKEAKKATAAKKQAELIEKKRAAEVEAKAKAKKEAKTEAKVSPAPEKKSEDGDDKEEEEDETPPPKDNGGKTDRYTWGQTLQEVTVTIPVPTGTRAKQLIVEIEPDTLRVQLKGGAVLAEGEFHKTSDSEDATWTLEDDMEVGKVLVLYIPKLDKVSWWTCILKGDPEINTQKIVPENSKLSELDGDVRGTVEKMMYDQNQKKKGLPTSDEQKKKDALKKFMDMHPEMDFSQAKIS